MITFRRSSVPAPGGRHKQHEHREDFQPAGQHIKNQNNFADVAVCREIAGGTDDVKTGTDVVQCGGDGGKIGFKGKAVKADDQD